MSRGGSPADRPSGLVGYARGLLARLVAPPTAAGREGPFAQFGEDQILERIFGGKGRGYCVEVGAYDGLTGSATYLFERKGWDCLLIEPLPESFEQITRNRQALVKNVAVSSTEGEQTFTVAENVEQMSTLQLTTEHDQWIRDVGGSARQVVVPTATLDTLLEEAGFPWIDFITIDVEGHELEVLKGVSLEKHKPRILIIEDNSTGGDSEVTRYLTGERYVNFRRTGVNDWYAHENDSALTGAEKLHSFRRQQRRQHWKYRLVSSLARCVPAPVRRALNDFVRGA